MFRPSGFFWFPICGSIQPTARPHVSRDAYGCMGHPVFETREVQIRDHFVTKLVIMFDVKNLEFSVKWTGWLRLFGPLMCLFDGGGHRHMFGPCLWHQGWPIAIISTPRGILRKSDRHIMSHRVRWLLEMRLHVKDCG
jgi:hypothetical protein